MSPISNKIPKNLKEKFDHVYCSICLFNSALTELQIISDHDYSEKELSIVNSHTFSLYKVTLQYCLIMEYTKLFERGRSNKEEHVSSLFRLNEAILKDDESFRLKFIENEENLTRLKSTVFFEHIKVLRDKKFAHSDSHEKNSPFNIKGFQTKDFEDAFFHLSIIKEVLINCSSEFDFEYDLQIPNSDNRTENFIRYQAKYKDYYFKDYLKARQEGL
ncbi:hypothetical protein BC952_0367 [Flavobacterium limicola]|uniref:HEPN AbiU2-like domain-containing protein n=1 Tax=Flavobacterium limicola TaxID=180441 RepID=A0A495S4I1_9FLAO|nr:hypothetical protein [Flavobacterium limicola]RKS94743.1 hypothetical protein BC952_0367 [Flavobacterium limicola]